MTKQEFSEGIKKVEAALQGAFDPNFVGHLWKYFGGEDAAYWGRICAVMCQSSKPARLLVFRDFLQVGIDERGRAHARRKVDQARESRQSEPQKLDILAIAERVAKRTKNRFHRDLVEKMRKERGK